MQGKLLAECLAHSKQSINISYNYWRPSGGRDLLKFTEQLRGRPGVRPRTSASLPRALPILHISLPSSENRKSPEGTEVLGSLNQLGHKEGTTCLRHKFLLSLTRGWRKMAPGLVWWFNSLWWIWAFLVLSFGGDYPHDHKKTDVHQCFVLPSQKEGSVPLLATHSPKRSAFPATEPSHFIGQNKSHVCS